MATRMLSSIMLLIVSLTSCSGLTIQNSALQKKQSAQPVFYYVAMSRLRNSHFLTTAIRSLREKGQFSGPVAVLTDSKECLIQNFEREKSWILGDSPPSYQDDFVTVYDSPSGPLHILSAQKVRFDQGYEQHKTRVRQHLSQAHLGFELETAVVIDEDILVANPVQPFLDHLSQIDAQKTPVNVFHDSIWAQRHLHQKHHCGLVVSLKDSEECMNQWFETDVCLAQDRIVEFNRTELKEKIECCNVYTKESRAYRDLCLAGKQTDFHERSSEKALSEMDLQGTGQIAFRSTQCMKDDKIGFLDDQFMEFPGIETMQGLPNATFVHFTKMKTKRLGGISVVQSWVKETLGMDSDVISSEHC